MTTLGPPNTATAVDLPRPGSWSLHWRGKVYRESDVTGKHLATLALITGTDDFESLDVDPRHGHQRLMQMLTACVTVDAAAGVAEDEVTDVLAAKIDEVSSASVDELLGALRYD